jgi:hypothetical protein
VKGAASLRLAGTHITGRAAYEAMAPVWPTTTGLYADVMNEIPKVMFSRTLTRADWPESQIANGDLIDEYRLVLHRVVIGHGTSLFKALREPLRLDLIEARTFPSGTAVHVYRSKEGDP